MSFFSFFQNRKITRVFRGVDNMGFAQAAKYELDCFKQIQKGVNLERVTYDLDEASPGELVNYNLSKLGRYFTLHLRPSIYICT